MTNVFLDSIYHDRQTSGKNILLKIDKIPEIPDHLLVMVIMINTPDDKIYKSNQ